MASNYDRADAQRAIDEAETIKHLQQETTVLGRHMIRCYKSHSELLAALKSAQMEIEILNKIAAYSACDSTCPPNSGFCAEGNSEDCQLCWRAWAEAQVDGKG
jgi:hypothetical protein